MASPSRYQQQQDEGDPRPQRRSKKPGPPIVPILALLVVMGGAVVIARMAAQNKTPEAPPKEKVLASDIFSDLPEEAPPDRSNARRRLVAVQLKHVGRQRLNDCRKRGVIGIHR